jgi:hypothetical protein
MPRRLLERCQPDSIREFRAAARERFEDGLALAGCGRRTGAIYVWGYSSEMTLKAAYFRLIGLGDADVIGMGKHVLPAIDKGRDVLGIPWPKQGQGHNVRAWADLLIAERAATPGAAYPHPFDREVQVCGHSIGLLWSETLRYHKNVAYPHEVRKVREAAGWLLANSDAL